MTSRYAPSRWCATWADGCTPCGPRPGRLALIAYADEANSSVGLFLTDLLRQGGDTVDFFRLWPMSGTLSYEFRGERSSPGRPPPVSSPTCGPSRGRGTSPFQTRSRSSSR